ncbi:hypothetical protein [Aestuariivirga sp.]|uniref:hypothetical protein n=1 Tax=Aestuariivirga sp. TaxID=2650926 RepID=UPI003BAB2235
MRRLGLAAFALCLATAPALAHGAGRGFVMLLPTAYVIGGGALAVLASFIALTALPGLRLRRPALPGPLLPVIAQTASLLSAGILVLVIILGVLGPRDPLENLLPLFVWTVWWVEIVMLHTLFGNMWEAINPFTGLHALIARHWGRAPGPAPLAYPAWLSYWPAVLIFFGFAWFQLVFPAPEDPGILASVIITYLLLSLVAVLAFGPRQWLGKADPFALFLAQLGAAAPLGRGGPRLPGAGLLALPALPLSGMLFVLLTLSAITFDGFSNTFLWLSMIGVNPLDFPGRTAVMGANTLGLLLSFAVLASGFFGAVFLGWRWAARPSSLGVLMGRLVYSLIPISIAYHVAHYLSDALVKVQYVNLALNDPLGNGADLFGFAHAHVTTSFQNTASGTLMLYTVQTVALVIGHVVGVAVAHAMVGETGLAPSCALKLELPLALVMVGYTGFGLWLLGTAAV